MKHLPKAISGSLLSVSLLLTIVSYTATAQTTYYSRAAGTYWGDTNKWSTSGHGGGSCNCVPQAGDIVLIGDGHTVYMRPDQADGEAASITINDDGDGGALIIGSGTFNGTQSLTVGTLTVNSGGTLQLGNTQNGTNTLNVTGNITNDGTFISGGNGGATNTLNFGGSITNNGTFNLDNSTDNNLAVFNGSASATIGGNGSTFTFNDITINAGGNNLNISANIRIEGVLTFSANGLLIVDANSNITLDNNASITGANANRYIQLDGTTGTNSQLIRENGADDNDWEFLFPIGTATGGYTPLDLTTGNGANVAGTNPDNNSTLAVKAIYSASSIGKMRRTFRLVVAGNDNATTMTNADFYYNTSTDVSAGDVVGNYSTLWYFSASAGWTTVTGTAPGSGAFTAPGTAQSLADGTYFYTIGISTAYPSIWYSYQNGNWSTANVWTQDPSGTTLVNPLNQYPSFGDEVVILNGFTVTSNLNNITLSKTTIEGGATLDMASTTGHNLGTVSGTGLLRINGVNLPSGTYTSFVASTGGTIEYYNTSGTLNGQAQYNNLIFSNSTGSAITFTTVNDLQINGDLSITQTGGVGTVTWQINDGTNDNHAITLTGDLTVSANGQIRVGTGNEGSTTQHSLTINGNITNNGSIKFYDDTDTELSEAQYTSGGVYTNELQGNAVSVTFSGVPNQTVTCNSQTDFYRFIVNKGTGRQAMLTVTSSNASNFRLFGPTDLSSSGASPNMTSNNALCLINGTLQLTGTIDIPNLCTNGAFAAGADYLSIPQNAGLWINSADVTVTIANNLTSNDDQRILIDGLLRISSGTLNGGYSRGIGAGNNGGIFLMEGGTVNVWQFRPLFGGNNIFSYIQTGGVLNIGTTGYNGTPSLDGVTDFIANGYARFSLPETTCSFQMSGGTINIGSPTTLAGAGGWDVQSSSANYNVTGGTVNFYITTGGNTFGINSSAPLYNVNIYKTGGGALTATLNQALTVLGSLTLVTGNNPTLTCNNNDLTIGQTLSIESGATLTPGTNTITFNGSGAQSWTHSGTITSLNNVVVNKSGGTLTLGGTQTFPDITGASVGLTLTAGTLDDGGKIVTVTNTLNNSATHVSTGSGAIVCNGPTAIGGTNGTFGNLYIQTNNAVTTSGRQTVTDDLRLISANTRLSIGSNNLTVLGNIYTDAAPGTAVAFSNTKRILTNGLRNDGGLTRRPTSGTDLLFPVGTSTILYTPATINVTASTVGTITVRPVANEHPNVTATNQSVAFFWSVTSNGFSGITSVEHKSYTFSTATKNGTLTTYRPARYNPTDFSWGYRISTYNATGTTVIPDFNTGGGTWIGLGSDELDGEYTAGNAAAFGTVVVYYSRASGAWNSTNTWSNTAIGGAAASSAPPCATCPVVIGDGAANNHTITIDNNNRSCGSLFISTGSVLDCSTFTGLNFGVNTGVGVSGKGTLRINSANFPAGDFTNFIGEDGGTVEWYGTTKTIPANGPAPQNIVLDEYYNLVISPNNAATITFPASDLTIYNNLTISGTGTGQANSNTAATRTITVNNHMNVTSGTFSIRNGNVMNMVLLQNMNVASGATVSLQGGGTRTHSLTSSGSITNSGTLVFRNGNEVVNITFTGTENESFTGTNAGATTTLNFITINKGSSQTPTLTLDVAGTVNTLTNNWLTLQNGSINFNKTGGSFTLTNTATTFSIPSTARLIAQAGTVNIGSINSDAADLLLSGTLEVSGGTVNIGVSTNDNNNDIEYAAAGTPTITVSAGTLYVNGGVRRSTATLSGALVYNQTGGTVTVGGRDCDANDERGVFEIENNPGSSFTLTGNSSLAVARSSGGTSFADLYLNPESSNVSSTSTIQLGANNLGNQTFSLNVVPTVGNFTVLGATGNAQTVNMQSSELYTTGTLTINQASTLNTNSLDVFVGGDLAITGTYNGSNNTTTFNGSGAQAASLSATSTFLHMTVNKSAGTATLSGTSPTITNLNILSGTLDVSTIGLTVVGDVVNNSAQTGTGSITMAGTSTSQTITSSGGSFTNLTLGGSATTKTVNVIGNMVVNGVLNFATTNRYLNIASYRLTLGTGSSVTGAGNTAFIKTNGVSSDLGVVKNWPVGANTFTYPVGTMSNYTPVQYTLTVTNAGSVTVIPVNSRHPSYGFLSTEQILNYYWIVRRDNAIAYNTTGSHVYSYPAGLMGGSGGTVIAGYLNLSNPTGWITSGHGGSATATTMTYTNSLNTNLPAAGITYHYTVGTIFTLPNPIAPVYSRLSNANVSNINVGGNWSDPNSWTLSTNGLGAAIANAPIGSPVVILSGARINVDTDARTALTMQIDGTLDLGTSVGHDFVVLTGTGTMRSSTNTFPAGDYTAFVAAGGGTIEYVAPMTMNNRSTYNNVSIIGTGSVTMTNTDIVLNGNLTIGSGATLSNSANNSDITIAGNWTNNGTFTPGTAAVTFNGSAAQTIAGSTTFNSLTINKAGGNTSLTGTATTTVSGTLTLTSGHIVTTSSHRLALASAATISGGSASSFISGPVSKVITAGGSFSYPLGSVSVNRYRPLSLANTGSADTWTVEYIGSNPYDPFSRNEVNIQKVSEFEHWDISHALGSNEADVTLSYNTGSYHGSDIGNVANLRVGHWDSGNSRWDLASYGTHSQSGTNIAGTVTAPDVTDFSPFTLSSLDLPSPLPLNWLSFEAIRVDRSAVQLTWKVAQEYNTQYFEVERSNDGLTFYKVGELPGAGTSTVARTYEYIDTEASWNYRHYYRIRQVDADGKSELSKIAVVMENGQALQRWAVSPNPVAEGQTLVLSQMDPVLDDGESVNIVIVSSGGQIVYQQTGSFSELSSNLERLSYSIQSGAYVMRIVSGSHHETFRIVKF